MLLPMNMVFALLIGSMHGVVVQTEEPCTHSKLIFLFVLFVLVVVVAAVVLATDGMIVCYFAVSNITAVGKLSLLFVSKKMASVVSCQCWLRCKNNVGLLV